MVVFVLDLGQGSFLRGKNVSQELGAFVVFSVAVMGRRTWPDRRMGLIFAVVV